jgi:hypothetical protein
MKWTKLYLKYPLCQVNGMRSTKSSNGKLFSGSYHDFLDKKLLLTRKLLNPEFLLAKLKSSFRKLYGRHHDLVNREEVSVSQMTTDMFKHHAQNQKSSNMNPTKKSDAS